MILVTFPVVKTVVNITHSNGSPNLFFLKYTFMLSWVFSCESVSLMRKAKPAEAERSLFSSVTCD